VLREKTGEKDTLHHRKEEDFRNRFHISHYNDVPKSALEFVFPYDSQDLSMRPSDRLNFAVVTGIGMFSAGR
jgi:hypothetical protein